MNKLSLAAAALMIAGAAVGAEKKPMACVVKIIGFDKSVTHRVMTAEEIKVLEAEIKAESRVFAKALELARKDWEKDDQTRRKPFPPLSMRSLVVGRLMELEKAEDKLAQAEDAASKRRVDDAEKQSEKDKQQKKSKETIAEEKKKEEEKEKLLADAIKLLEAKLEQLKSEAGEAPAR